MAGSQMPAIEPMNSGGYHALATATRPGAPASSLQLPSSQAAHPYQSSRPTARAQTAAAPPTNSDISIILYDLQSGIRRAQTLIQSVSTEVSSISSRMAAAKAYSLELQAQQEISKLQTAGVGQLHQWYA